MKSPQPGRFDAVVPFPAMHVGVRTSGQQLAAIVYLPASVQVMAPANRLAERAARQFDRYRHDPDYRFDLPLAPCGSDFQRRVWQAISAVARGKTLTYGAMAKALRSVPRAVGQACGANPFPLVVPCHLVVAAAGLGGFAHHSTGFHIEAKRWLLAHEKAL